jgi:ribosomal protein S18 acetylase RimI-like enzyme
MTVHDWSSVPATALEPIYTREAARWRRALAWDTANSWNTVETARTSWGLPGFVCRDRGGRVRGCAFYLTRDDGVDVGGVSADGPPVTAALVEALVARAGTPGKLRGLLYASAPHLERELQRHQVPVTRYSYQMRSTRRESSPPACIASTSPPFAGGPGAGWSIREWQVSDVDATAALLQDAYGDAGRLLVPSGELACWRDYVSNLLNHDACGVLSPAMSPVFVMEGQLGAVALMSTIGQTTAHLLQLAVAPRLRRSGIARTLLQVALNAAECTGHRSTSLLVADSNTAAVRLYRDAGFLPHGTFLGLTR